MQLTPDQEAAAAAFTMFAVSNDTEMVISGSAGTGKTTLLKHLMKYQDPKHVATLLGNKLPSRWVLTATTNKAAEVLAAATGAECSTVHAALGLRVLNDYENGTQQIARKGGSEVLENAFLVVDEASMIDRDLDRFISGCTYKCKILYIGDHCQMAPVMEDLSPVFARNKTHELKQVVRSQHTPAITALCNQLRHTVETGQFRPMQEVPGVIDYLDSATAEVLIQDLFVDQARDDVRILAYTNNKVIALNNYLRQHRHLPEHYVVNDKLVSNTVCYTLGGYGGARKSLRVEQDITVHGVDLMAIPFPRIKNTNLMVYTVTTNGGDVYVPVDQAHYKAHLAHYKKNKDWQNFFSLKENVADLRPRDACTVYKAQGSTYHTVFVDLSDIGTCTNAAQAARMLYVACSRPTHRICFIGQLPARFRGA